MKIVPEKVDQNIKDFVFKDLNPSRVNVFIKLLFVHVFTGVVTLTFCPQFSLSLTNKAHTFHYIHRTYGPVACHFLCGIIFLAIGAAFALFILNRSEIKVISKQPVLFYFSISIIFEMAFLLLGAEVYLSIAISWLLGGIVSGLFVFSGIAKTLWHQQI